MLNYYCLKDLLLYNKKKLTTKTYRQKTTNYKVTLHTTNN